MILSPFERAIHAIEFIFVVFEAILGYFAIKIMVSHQAVKFHMKMEFNNLDEVSESGEVGIIRNGKMYNDRYRQL